MALVGTLGLGYRIVIAVDHPVQIFGYCVSYLIQLLVVEGAVFYKLGQGNGGQVAHCYLIGRGVFDNLGTQVARLNSAQIFLVRFFVGGILVEHVGGAGLHLCFQYLKPQVLSLHLLTIALFFLIFFIEALKLLTIAVGQAGCFVGAEERPHFIVLHTLHKQVGYPQGIKQVAGSQFFFAVVFLQVQEGKDIGMPGLQIDGKAALALASALVHVAGGHVEVAQHWHDAVGYPIGAFDVRARGPDVVDAQADTSGRL